MRRIIMFTTLGVLIALGVGSLLWERYDRIENRRERLLGSFTGAIPDTLGDEKMEEIEGLVRMLWTRFDQGWVGPEDLEEVESGMRRAADRGYIGGRSLVILMAKVGYYTYKGMPDYNLSDGTVDHPELNPDAAASLLLRPDSATLADFEVWKEKMMREGKIDTLTGRYNPYGGRR